MKQSSYNSILVILWAICILSAGGAEQTVASTTDADDTADLLRELAFLKEQNKTLEVETQTLEEDLEYYKNTASVEDDSEEVDYFDMSLEQLMEVELITSALTKTTVRKSPNVITHIDKEDIARSGARSLMELLDLHVPNFQWIHVTDRVRSMGLRGVQSGRQDKFLLLVNGRVMNERTGVGVFSERDLPMLGDIEYVEVVRGSGSALYGPGAILMVINIVTENADTFEGFETITRIGGIENFYSNEFKYGKKFDDDSGLYLYGGWSEYPGASLDHAELSYNANVRLGSNPKIYPGEKVTSMEDLRYNETNDNKPKYKFHAAYTKGNFNLWGRFTQGGEMILHNQNYQAIRYGEDMSIGYRQGTITANYLQEIDDDLSLDCTLSFDRMEIESSPITKARSGRFWQYREDEYYARMLARWNPSERHSLAGGFAWTHEEFGDAPMGEKDAFLYNYYTWESVGWPIVDLPHWSTDMFSVLGEWQWNLSDLWTSFVSARIDRHPYTSRMFSPRWAMIYTPNKKETFKFMFARAVRMPTAAEMHKDYVKGKPSAQEKQDSLEIRYENQFSDNLWLAAGAFYNDLQLVDWDNTEKGTNNIATQKTAGFELEASYRKDKYQFNISHGFTKLIDLTPNNGQNMVKTSVSYLGHGDDLANWFNHNTKMRFHYEMDEKWSHDTSLNIYWNNPGGMDLIEYRYRKGSWFADPSDEHSTEFNFYLNWGLKYQHCENLSIRFDAYNILGLFNDDLNLRRAGAFNNDRPGAAWNVPATFAFQLNYKF